MIGWLAALQVNPPDFPLLGNNWAVAILFTLHVAVAEYSVGAVTLSPVMEWWGARHGDPRALRYARIVGNSYYYVFSMGATLAVFAVVLLTGLFGRDIGELFDKFQPLVGIAFGLFLVLTPLLVWWHNTFAKMAPRRHACLGGVLAVLQTFFVVLIVGIDAYLITPNHAGLADAALNPPYVWLLLHRLAGNISWAALVLSGIAALLMRAARTDDERLFHSWAARVTLRIGLLFALVMPVDGFVLVEVLRHTQPGYFENLVGSQTGSLMVLQELLVGVVLVGGGLALTLERRDDGGRAQLGGVLTAVTAVGMVVACQPTAVLSSWYGLRYVGLGTATAVTALHLLLRRRVAVDVLPTRRSHTSPTITGQPAQPRIASVGVRRVLVTVGVASMATALLMGTIKEHARGSYAIYGELRQDAAHRTFTPPPGNYP